MIILNSQRGFTLVEILVSIALFSIVITMFTTLLGQNIMLQDKSSNTAKAQLHVEEVMSYIKLNYPTTSVDSEIETEIETLSLSQNTGIYEFHAQRLLFNDGSTPIAFSSVCGSTDSSLSLSSVILERSTKKHVTLSVTACWSE